MHEHRGCSSPESQPELGMHTKEGVSCTMQIFCNDSAPINYFSLTNLHVQADHLKQPVKYGDINVRQFCYLKIVQITMQNTKLILLN